MDEKKLDSLIGETLAEEAGQMKVSPDMQYRIRRRIEEENKEEKRMKHRISGKVIILAAALCLLGTMGAIAAGRSAGLVSHTYANNPSYRSYGEMKEHVKEDMGFNVKTAETLAEGYEFSQAFVIDVQAQDEAGNTVGVFRELNAQYGGKKAGNVSLSVSRPGTLVKEETKQPDAVGEYEGIELDYFCDKYKFLPPGSTVSEEDRLAEERGELHISYGSDKEEVSYFYTVSWREDGVRYSIMAMDQSFTSEEMFAMAAKVISEK